MRKVIISYIPAMHQGYVKFLSQHGGHLMLLGHDFIHETPRMERDIRAIEPSAMADMIRALGIVESVEVLEGPEQLALVETAAEIILPDEDVNRRFAENHLSKKPVRFEPSFLRWDRQISTVEFEVPPNRIVSHSELDRELITMAEREANKSADWWRQIGAVIAKDGKPVLVGHNRPLTSEDYTVNIFGDPRSNFDYGEYIELVKTIHAESGLIAEAAKRGVALEGASMYVTTFPCPVCAKLIAAAGFKTVYYSKGYSMLDAEDVFKAHEIEVVLVK